MMNAAQFSGVERHLRFRHIAADYRISIAPGLCFRISFGKMIFPGIVLVVSDREAHS